MTTTTAVVTMDTLPLDVLTVLGVLAWAGWFVWLSVDQARRTRTRRELIASGRLHPWTLDLDNLGAMRSKRTEHGVANDHVQQAEVHERSDEQANDQRSIHARMVHLPPGVPSITERMDPWLFDILSEPER